MSKFSVGDTARVVSSWDEVGGRINVCAVQDMDRFLGTEVTIKQIEYRNSHATYRIAEDLGLYFWYEECFISPNPVSIEDLLSVIEV